jgi:hypothetical protein
MEFKLPYMQAMRQQAPKLFNRLSRSGGLEAFVNEKAQEASKLFHELTANAPKEAGGYPKEPEASEAIEQVMAVMLDFPKDEQTTRQVDERAAMNGKPLT